MQEIYEWLRGLPGLENLENEHLSAAPGSTGLFCQGRELLGRKRDITGGEERRWRLRWLLAAHTTGARPAALEQMLPAAPELGREQTVTLEKTRLTKAGRDGVARFEARLTVEYTE